MKWFILFLSLPIIEIYVFLEINKIIGIPFTLAIIIGTALIGTIFVRSQALKVFSSFKSQSINPLLFISNGLLIFISGILLLTPGFITDLVGFALLIPNLRNLIILSLSKKFIQKNSFENEI